LREENKKKENGTEWGLMEGVQGGEWSRLEAGWYLVKTYISSAYPMQVPPKPTANEVKKTVRYLQHITEERPMEEGGQRRMVGALRCQCALPVGPVGRFKHTKSTKDAEEVFALFIEVGL